MASMVGLTGIGLQLVPASASLNGVGVNLVSTGVNLPVTGVNVRPGGASPAGLPLDGISTGIKAAFSTRQLLSSYVGPAMQVTRASDSTTANIGFVGNVLDTATLATFCAGTTGSVTTWFDQGGGGFNLIPGTAAPVIFQSGAVITINSKPAVSFTAASAQFLKNTSLTSNPVNTLYQNAVIIVNSFATVMPIMGSTASGLLFDIATTGVLDITAPGVVMIAESTNAVTAATGAVVENQYDSTTGAWAFWINRASGGTGSSPQTFPADTVLLGDYGNGFFKLDGSIGEYIAFDLVGGIPTASQTSIENNQKAFWGTP
jgi:Alpha-L-arabinofuranosidase B, catalytic